MNRIRPTECRAVLKDVIRRNTPDPAGVTAAAIPGLLFHRQNGGAEPTPHFFEPVIILVAQGSKRVRVGDEERVFGENVCFVSGAALPVSSCVVSASPDRPYLALSLALDAGLIAALSAEMPAASPPDGGGPLQARAACRGRVKPRARMRARSSASSLPPVVR